MEIRQRLVLGASGRIGAVLRRAWRPGRTRWQSRRAMAGPGWVLADPLADPEALARAAAGVSAIVCLSGVTPARAGQGGDMADNVALALAAIRAAAPSGARVLLASSAAVYGNRAGRLGEDTPPAPVSDYGRAKLEMERAGAESGSDLGVQVTALRIGNIAGLDAILGGWRPGFQLDQLPDGRTPARSYIGPVTLARVLDVLLDAPDLPRVLNVAAPGTVEMGALLDAAARPWTPRPAPADVIPEVALDVAALCRFTPLSPADSLPETLLAECHEMELA